jgi:hypothetical protein
MQKTTPSTTLKLLILCGLLLAACATPAQAAQPPVQTAGCQNYVELPELWHPSWSGAPVGQFYQFCLDAWHSKDLVSNHWLGVASPQVLGYFQGKTNGQIFQEIWGPWVIPLFPERDQTPLFDAEGRARQDVTALSLREGRVGYQRPIGTGKRIDVLFFLPNDRYMGFPIPYGGGTVFWAAGGPDAPYMATVSWNWVDTAGTHKRSTTVYLPQTKGRVEVAIVAEPTH